MHRKQIWRNGEVDLLAKMPHGYQSWTMIPSVRRI